ncbi:MAG: peptidoglycan DD-metalloendopeptidase family protein [Lachnospiraceae bacterium]|nr:peptidoglycan DD-metalloendopeptidase family protein [Lachnospiraceae bacterium]
MDDKEVKKKREKINYNVLFVPDKDTEAVKHLSVSLEVLIGFFAAIAFLIIAALAYCFIVTGELNRANNNVLTLKTQVDEITQKNTELTDENNVLQEKVTILSDTVNDKVQQEEEREAEIAKSYIPTGFPLKGTASYSEEETELDGNPIAIFHASRGTSVIATANGTVSSIAGSAEAGYIVMIDHGNGYYSVYRNGAEPEVKEGDEVTSSTELFDIQTGYEQLGYQIIENEAYIDPLELMEIYG